MRYAVSLFAAVLVALATRPALAQMGPGYGYGYGHMWDGGGWGHGWFIGPVMMVLFVVGIIVLIVALWRWGSRTGHPGPYHGHGFCPHCGYGRAHRRAALDILEERFAKGEIGAEEFEEKRKLLGP